MKKGLLLFLTDDVITLDKGSSKQTYSFSEGVPYVQSELTNVFSLTPKAPICLFIDRNHQDVKEEQLPPLMPWDRLRFFLYKRESWRSQGEFHGYRFFKQNRKLFLQWVNITQNDSLSSWLSWIKSLSNPLNGIFFISLEAGKFLKRYASSNYHYHMLIYKVSSHRARFVIFEGKRLLLFRPFSGEEDLRMSLHFLSRVYPDIHEKLQVLNLVNEIPLTFPHTITVSDPYAFMDFLSFQKWAALPLNINPILQNQWRRRGIKFIFVTFLLIIGIIVYKGLYYKRKTNFILSEIEVLNNQVQHQKALLKNRDITFLHSALNHYYHLASKVGDPLKTLEPLASVLARYQLQLQNLTWNYGDHRDIEMRFSMPKYKNKGKNLATEFSALLSSFAEIFPLCHIQVLEGPFKSSSHETYTHPTESSFPMIHIRIVHQ